MKTFCEGDADLLSMQNIRGLVYQYQMPAMILKNKTQYDVSGIIEACYREETFITFPLVVSSAIL